MEVVEGRNKVEKKSKVLIIGLDGASLDLIEKWKDELPSLKRLLERGAYGLLESCIPPVTIPAWHCMFTGKNPGRLGVFNFIVHPIDVRKGIKFHGAFHKTTRYLWDFLGSHGFKVIVMGVPNTYPPKKVNGIMVSGSWGGVLLTHLPKDTDYTYPSSLKGELDRAVDGYEMLPLADPDILDRGEDYVQEYDRILLKQATAARYLMTEYPWDLFVCVLFTPDPAQHYFWAYMDSNHPKWTREKGERYGTAIKHFYRKIDGVIASLIAEVPPETIVMIVSDHGAGPLYGEFCINEFLRQRGLLKLRRGYGGSTHVLSEAVNSSARFLLAHVDRRCLQSLLKRAPRQILDKLTLRQAWIDSFERLFTSIDWSRTKAYGVPPMEIIINRKDRSENGIVEDGEEYERLRDQIIEMLYEVKDPSTGDRIVGKVFKKEEVYRGEYLDIAPDLISVMGGFRFKQSIVMSPGELWVDPTVTGSHSFHGLLMAYGRGMKAGRIVGAKIYDITPTVLHIFGVPVPAGNDGRVLHEIFEERCELRQRPVVFAKMTEKERVIKAVRQLKSRGRVWC